MGNEDGLFEAIANMGTNEIINIKGSDSFFSFALGNEIALVIDENYYILNCDKQLWDEVKEFVNAGKTFNECIHFWNEKAEIYEISEWSDEFPITVNRGNE